MSLFSIFLVAFILSVATAEEDEPIDTASRYSFGHQASNYCSNKHQGTGLCVPLKECKVLQDSVQHLSSMYILNAVGDHACGFGPNGLQVCCPDSESSRPSNVPKRQTNNRPQTSGYSVPLPQWGGGGGYSNWGSPNNGGGGSYNSWGNNNNGGAPNPNGWGNQGSQWGKPNSNYQWGQPTTTKRPWNPPPPTNNWNTPKPNKPSIPVTTERNDWGTATTGPWSPPKVEEPPANLQTKTNHRNRRLLPEKCGEDVANKILGGNETSLEEHPWMALIRLRMSNGQTTYLCGGSLINPRYVLTAAHCIKNPRIPSSAVIDQVRLGEHDLTKKIDCDKKKQCAPQPDDVEIEQRIVHPQYSTSTDINDIALLRLKRPAKINSYVRPICLPLDSLEDMDFQDKEMWTAGWGKTSNNPNSQSNVKMKVSLPYVTYQQCTAIYNRSGMIRSTSQMCAGGEADKDSCQGDSGGPLMTQELIGPKVRWIVQGIVSIGPANCGTVGSPGVYTRVSKYLDWILDNMRD